MMMKLMFRSMLIATLIFGVSGVVAQKGKKDNPDELKFVKSLSKSQKIQYQEYKALVKADKKRLKDSYSAEQMAIYKNKTMGKAARKEALIATYTPDQVALRRANIDRRKEAKKALKSTFSERQKLLWDRVNNKGKKKKKI